MAQYQHTALAGETRLRVCNFIAPNGWAITQARLPYTGRCGIGGLEHEISNLTNKTQVNTCSSLVPGGWAMTGARSSTNGLCGTGIQAEFTMKNLDGLTGLTTCSFIAPAGWGTVATNVSSGGACAAGGFYNSHRIINLEGKDKATVCASYLGAALPVPSGWEVYAVTSNSQCGSGSNNAWNIIDPTPPVVAPKKVALHHYSNAGGDHFYSIKKDDAGLTQAGYSYVGIEGYVFDKPTSLTTPLSRYYSAYIQDHLYTPIRNDAGYANYTYDYEGVEGHILLTPEPGTVALHHYHNAFTNNNYYTQTYFTNGGYGFTYKDITGYVYPNP